MTFTPIDSAMLDAALSVFRKVSGVSSGFVATIFVARITLLVASVASVEAYGKLFKDIAFFFIAITLFPQVFKIVVSSVGTLSASVGSQAVASGGGATATDELMLAMMAQMPILGFLVDVLPLSITYIAQSIFSIIIGLLCAIAPVMFLSHLISGSLVGLQQFLSTLIILCLWPVLWNVLGLLRHELAPTISQTSLGSFCFAIVVQVLQLISPLVCMPLFKSGSLAQGISKAAAIKTLVSKRIDS